MLRNDEGIAAIDIGTSKVSVAVGKRVADGSIDVIGFGHCDLQSPPDRSGRDPRAVSRSLRSALDEAALIGGYRVHRAYLGICASQARGADAYADVAIEDGEVTEEDIEAALDAVGAPGPAPGRTVLQKIVHEYRVDHGPATLDPRGIRGRRLHIRAHIVTVAESALRELLDSCSDAGVEVAGVVLETLASGYSVLAPEEREVGVVLIDIGSSSTDIAIWHEGKLVHTASIEQGGDELTRCVAQSLRTSFGAARQLKERHGCAIPDMVPIDDEVWTQPTSHQHARRVGRRMLANVMEPTLIELFRTIRRQIEISGWVDVIRGGAVLVGGTAAMEGVRDLAEAELETQVREGMPQGCGGKQVLIKEPKHAAAVGVMLYAARHPETMTTDPFGGPPMRVRLFRTVKALFDRIV